MNENKAEEFLKFLEEVNENLKELAKKKEEEKLSESK